MKKKFRISTSEKAKSAKQIYVFCPVEHVDEIRTLSKAYTFEIIVNNYSLTELSDKVVCHYESQNLTKKEKLYLVDAMERGAWVEPLVSYLDSRLGYTEVSLLGSSYFLHQKAFSILSTPRTQKVKRIADISLSLIFLLAFSPLMILTALLIKLESKGAVFYKQKRTGQFNEEFEVIKFRSMRADAEKHGAKWASKNDARVTKVGKFIRKTRIDEIPQFINVLKGEMSIVGPRPEREIFINTLESEIPYYRFRHAVKPGITGLAQVSYPYGDSVEDAVWKHKYDLHYIKHHSSMTDFYILLKTVKVVLFGMGR